MSLLLELGPSNTTTWVLRITGEALDARAAAKCHLDRLDSEWHESLGRVLRLVVDLGGLHALDASGLAWIVQLYQRLGPGSRMMFCGANAAIRRLLEETWLDEIFPVLDDLPPDFTVELRLRIR